MRDLRFSSALLGLLATILWLSGCAGYQLGTGSTPKFATLYIAPVTSEALIPQAQALVTTELREAFIRDGRVRLVNSADEADAVLTVALAAYNRAVAVSRPDDTGLARRFDVNLTARATLTDNRTKQPLFTQRALEARRGVFTDSGLVPSEYQALPLLAGLIANEAVHAALDTW
ncbi:MAG TPA: LPS assembly lipoprotein LptE [Lacunisphaera sp.]|nr:LPS assembly lipoprotein LptE [Lacunisphaera sp.]